jgi:hypothetical protein
MKRADYISIGVLMLVPFLIFYSLFTTTYLYTDEAVQLWYYRKGSDFHMFTSQGRIITEKLFQWLFSSIASIQEVTYLRLLSFFGWIVSIPIWYIVLKKVICREGLPAILAFFSVLYMVTMPPFLVYVSWASCMELFLANTSALLSGYFLYSSIDSDKKLPRIQIKGAALSVLFGIFSLFTYQTGFGCFLLPFLLNLIASQKITRTFWTGVGACFIIYILYFLIFKLGLVFSALEASNRTTVYFNPIRKIVFMLTRPLAGSFHFTFLFNERSIAGLLAYLLIAGAWFFCSFWLLKSKPLWERVLYFGAVLFLLFCIYIPGLIVKENYASNRTLFALNLAVFFLVFDTLFRLVRASKSRFIMVSVLSSLFVVNAWYNFNILFLFPLKEEYQHLKAHLDQSYKPDVHTVYFICPEEDFFVRRFGITRSWDEFGVPSTFFDWVPEHWVKQVVFEKTGDRAEADKLVIKHWLGRDAYTDLGKKPSKGILLIDVEQILSR